VAKVEYILSILFALAVSADGFLVGIAYGLRKITIPFLSLLLIACASTAAVTLSMVFGKGLSTLLNPAWASNIGAAMLILIGLYFLLQALKEKISTISAAEDYTILTLNLEWLGIIVQILKKPSSADMDCSGEINLREAFFLGLALAVDALGAGMGAAMTGLNILFTALCVGMLKFILVNSGIYLGRVAKNKRLQGITSNPGHNTDYHWYYGNPLKSVR
jgi:putative sporulation protein YtaF